MKLEIETYAKSDLSSEQLGELEEWFQKQFGHLPYQWAWGTLNWYVLGRNDHELIGCLGILKRTVSIAERRVQVGGIAGVITHPEWRRRGVASALLKEAVVFIERSLGREFALLLCRDEIIPVYARVGWKRVKGPTWFSQPSGKRLYPGATMVYQCGQRVWPPGPIDLCGLPW